MADDKAMETVDNVEVLDDDGTMRLRKPLPNGKDELVFDFDRVNGYKLVDAERRAKREDNTITVALLSQVYLAHVTAAACGVKYDDILSLSATDFSAAVLRTQNFLAGNPSQAR